MATQVEQVTQQEIEQEVHADIYNVSKEDLEKKRKEQAKSDDGGSICTICYVKGCRIGPMGRG